MLQNVGYLCNLVVVLVADEDGGIVDILLFQVIIPFISAKKLMELLQIWELLRVLELSLLKDGALPSQPLAEVKAFREELNDMRSALSAVSNSLSATKQKLKAMRTAAERTSGDTKAIIGQLHEASMIAEGLDVQLNGDPIRSEIGERNNPTLQSRFSTANRGASSSYGPTAMHQENLVLAKKEFSNIRKGLENLGG